MQVQSVCLQTSCAVHPLLQNSKSLASLALGGCGQPEASDSGIQNLVYLSRLRSQGRDVYIFFFF